uniref:U3 small nucleolar RNA-associated protein 15 homolog n=1 Tax=Meloidogyne incognita TaxID=6306 RepID=A0A914LZM6_MELIC
MTTHFKPIQPLRDANAEDGFSDEQKYWMRLEEAAVFEESCCSCDFKPSTPYSLAVAGGSRVIVFDTATTEQSAIYSRFKTSICSIKYRHDGALLVLETGPVDLFYFESLAGFKLQHLWGSVSLTNFVLGDHWFNFVRLVVPCVSTENGFLQFFDTHSEKPRKQGLRTPIRTIKAHKSQIYSFQFDAGGHKVASFSDDCYTKLFDLATENASPIWNCGAHMDFIRTGAFVPNNEFLLATGSYDNTIHLWDTRQDGSSFVREFNHGLPVEKILFMSSQNNLLASAGGNLIKFWDLNNGQIVKELQLHKKTITSLKLSKDETFLISGSTDRRVNIVKLDNFDLVHTWHLDAPIQSLAIDHSDNHVAFGLGNNNLAIWRRKEEEKVEKIKKTKSGKRKRKRNESKDVLQETITTNNNDVGIPENIEEEEPEERPKGLIIFRKERDGEQEKVELKLTERQLEQMKLGDHDYLLREGRVQELVSTILLKIKNYSFEYIVAVFHQIRIRQQLKLAISNLERFELVNLFQFLTNNIGNKQFFDILYDVIVVTLEIYVQKPLHRDVRNAVRLLQKILDKEIEAQKKLLRNGGLFEMMKNGNKNNLTVKKEEKLKVKEEIKNVEMKENEEEDGEEDEEEKEEEKKKKKKEKEARKKEEKDEKSKELKQSKMNGKINLNKPAAINDDNDDETSGDYSSNEDE